MQFYRSLLLLLLIGICNHIQSQELLSSRTTSYYTYIYSLQQHEYDDLSSQEQFKSADKYLHTLVDSFPTDSIYQKQLPPGNYVRTYIKENLQQYDIVQIRDIQVFLLNNTTDLCIQITNREGDIISDAEVKVRNASLKFDDKTQSYIKRKTNKKGVLTVDYKGITSRFNLDRKYNNSWVKRSVRNVDNDIIRPIIYRTPLRYAWRPVRNIISIPIKGAKAAIKGRRFYHPTIISLKYFFENSYYRIACLFDDYHCGDWENNGWNKTKAYGYMVFNQPIYRPGDTVKFKAYLYRKKKPLNKTAKLFIEQSYRKDKFLTKLEPYRKGGYASEIILHDSLNMKLDWHYNVCLKKRNKVKYICESFKYEDYELKKSSLSVRTSHKKQYKDKAFTVIASAKDENDLPLRNARIELVATVTKVEKVFDSLVFVPNELFTIKKPLVADSETKITIPDSLFPSANFSYTINVRMLTADNEEKTETLEVDYFHKKEEFDVSLKADSLLVGYLEEGHRAETEGQIVSVDNNGIKKLEYEGKLPHSIKLNPFLRSYIITSDKAFDEFNIANESSQLNCYQQRTHDSVYFEVVNPQKLWFNYHIYKANREVARGYSDSLLFHIADKSKTQYVVTVDYVWGGTVKELVYKLSLKHKQLNIAVDQPEKIYPGEKVKIKVKLTDYKNKPAEGIDLTAFGLTKKFGYSPPKLDEFSYTKRRKDMINTFSLHKNKTRDSHLELFKYSELKQWNLDTNEFYRFRYPNRAIYTTTVPSADKITEVAPFLMNNGGIETSQVVYIDNEPRYFSWTTAENPYSFKVSPGWHKIQIRLSDTLVHIDSVYCEIRKKTILSISNKCTNKHVKFYKRKIAFSDYEQTHLNNYSFVYKNSFVGWNDYIKNRYNYQQMPQSYHRIIGRPVSGMFEVFNNDSSQYHHYNNRVCTYDFQPKVIVKELVKNNVYGFNYGNHKQSINDHDLTKKEIDRRAEDYMHQQRINMYYKNRYVYSYGSAHLEIKNPFEKHHDSLLNILLFKYDQYGYLKIENRNTSTIRNLAAGHYKLIFLYKNNRYFSVDSVELKGGGNTYLTIQYPDTLLNDEFSTEVSSALYEAFEEQFYNRKSIDWTQNITDIHFNHFTYTGTGKTVSGQFLYEDGSPIKNVKIYTRNSIYGTYSDSLGRFSLIIPNYSNQIRLQYGDDTETIMHIDSDTTLNLLFRKPFSRLIPYHNSLGAYPCSITNRQLDEVAVVGYTVQKKEDITGAITSMSAEEIVSSPMIFVEGALQGKAAGVQVTTASGAPGAGTQVRIRGTNGSAGVQPLYVVNGVPLGTDISHLNPGDIESISVLKDASSAAIYGARGANGVVLIKLKDGLLASPDNQQENKSTGFNALISGYTGKNTMRSNFSDYAFWQPKLITDENGEAEFEVVFPDDITSWETFYLAMDGKQRMSGQAQSNIKSYKPLMAQLSVPRFLVEGDSAIVLGSTQNYTPAPIQIKTAFEIDDTAVSENDIICKKSVIDSLLLIAQTDTLAVKYSLSTEGGYFDGEKRKVPVFRKGMKETKGDFYALNNDTTISVGFDTTMGQATIYARADMLSVLEDEIAQVIDYKYLCNEQISSKINMLLNQKLIDEYKGEEFTWEEELKKLLSMIEKRYKQHNLWGWWENSATNMHISIYVVETLLRAEKQGYECTLSKEHIANQLVWKLNNTKSQPMKVRILSCLRSMNMTQDYQSHINEINDSLFSNNQKLLFIKLKQDCGFDYSLDSVYKYKQQTLFGNMYFSNDNVYTTWWNNDIQMTALAYNILKDDSTTNKNTLQSIQRYFFERRKTGYWRNTYESATIVSTILPDLIKKEKQYKPSQLTFSGDTNITVLSFPFEMKTDASSNFTINKTGSSPVYLTSYQTYWNSEPVKKQNDFIVTSNITNKQTLIAGERFTITVHVQVLKDAEYVMLNIPIPASCSYAEKPQAYSNEAHREYYKNETAIFCESLKRGNYNFNITVIPRYSGTFTINPAKMELMYFPTFNANTEMKKVYVE